MQPYDVFTGLGHARSYAWRSDNERVPPSDTETCFISFFLFFRLRFRFFFRVPTYLPIYLPVVVSNQENNRRPADSRYPEYCCLHLPRDSNDESTNLFACDAAATDAWGWIAGRKGKVSPHLSLLLFPTTPKIGRTLIIIIHSNSPIFSWKIEF